MPELSESVWPVSIGFAVALAGSVLITLTKRWHGAFTFDTAKGPQKFHDAPTPRIGGLAIVAGLWAATGAASPPIRELLFALGASGTVAFASGLAEDLTKRISTTVRLLATMLSGLLFCLLTGYAVTRLEIRFVDDLMGWYFTALAFTAFAIAGMSNAVNILDGFHGLAAGSVIIMLSAFGVVAHVVGDAELVSLVIVIAATLSGFLLVNFPGGYVFLGDGGAYFSGFLLGCVAVMLPMRNPEVSVWISIVILAYPLLETGHAIIRKTSRRGHKPTQPDRLHLHMLLYRRLARTVKNGLANPVTGLCLWGGAMTSLVFAVLIPPQREWALFAFALQIMLYALAYRQVAPLRRRSVPEAPKWRWKRN